MQEKEWNKLNFPSGFYNIYRGIPLYRDVIIKTKNNKTIIGELRYVSLYENGDILYLQTKKGKIDIDTNNIDNIDLYIEEENKMSKKEQLLNELEQIKNEFKEKIENVQKQIEGEDNKNEWWIPKEGERYWFIDTNKNIKNTVFCNGDMHRINNLNYFETEQQAKRQSFEELLHRKLNKFAYENNEEIDWDNKEQYKYIILCHNNKLECFGFLDNFGRVCFTSEEIAKKAIKEFKDDLIRYFTSDK